MVVMDGQKCWYRLVSVSFADTLAFNTKYRYQCRWISSIDTGIGIGIAEAQTPILVSVSVSVDSIWFFTDTKNPNPLLEYR